MMTLELPDDLRPLDEQLKQALQVFAPPANLDAKIVSHVSRRSRLWLVSSPRLAKGAAALVAASLLAAVGYVADRQMNGGRSSESPRDMSGLVALAERGGDLGAPRGDLDARDSDASEASVDGEWFFRHNEAGAVLDRAPEGTIVAEGKAREENRHFAPGQLAQRGEIGQGAKELHGTLETGRPTTGKDVGRFFENAEALEGEKSPQKPSPPAEPVGPAPQPEPASVDSPAAPVRQKVIRNGTVEFEVDSFDTALTTITKLVVENGGFVSSTDSAKLPNGKTRGAVSLRVPPERLDALVLMLRGIGDLKSQKISAQDVSKQYTDIESQLRAARAMEERLLEMIKKGNGSIKDLLAAEKELGVWREKIEKLEGEIRYYDNLIAMSTLAVVVQERDIKASAASIETETVSAGVETDDVEKARDAMLTTIDEAKGRVITSDLKKLDAGQFSATIVAEVVPERAGLVIDRLKQLGKVTRLDIDRRQATVDGTAAPVPGARVERQPTRLTISLYNLANVAPRLTTTSTLASSDVEAAYRSIMKLAEEAGGRIVTSQLQRPQADQIQANLQIEVPSAQAAETRDAITSLGEVVSLQVSENADTVNVTTAKQGFAVRIVSVAVIPARETVTLQLASPDVVKAHQSLAAVAAKADAHVVQSNVTEGDGDTVNAVLHLDLPRAALAEWDEARKAVGDVMTRSVLRSTDQQNTLDSKVRINLTMFPADRLPPRQVTTAVLRVRSSESQQQAFLAKAMNVGGRIIDQSVSRNSNGYGSGRVVLDVPRERAVAFLDDLRSAGEIASMNTSTNPQAPEGPLARTRFDVQFTEHEGLVSGDSGFWSSIKAGLATSLKGLGYSLRLLVVAVCLVAPWAAVLWGGWKLFRRRTAAARTPPQIDA